MNASTHVTPPEKVGRETDELSLGEIEDDVANTILGKPALVHDEDLLLRDESRHHDDRHVREVPLELPSNTDLTPGVEDEDVHASSTEPFSGSRHVLDDLDFSGKNLLMRVEVLDSGLPDQDRDHLAVLVRLWLVHQAPGTLTYEHYTLSHLAYTSH